MRSLKHAVGMITDVITDAFDATGLSADDLAWFCSSSGQQEDHRFKCQKAGNCARKGCDDLCICMGNTSAASIPLALNVAVKDGPYQER